MTDSEKEELKQALLSDIGVKKMEPFLQYRKDGVDVSVSVAGVAGYQDKKVWCSYGYDVPESKPYNFIATAFAVCESGVSVRWETPFRDLSDIDKSCCKAELQVRGYAELHGEVISDVRKLIVGDVIAINESHRIRHNGIEVPRSNMKNFTGEYVVVNTSFDGGGMNYDGPFPNGHHVWCESISGTMIDFWQSGAFRCMIENITPIRHHSKTVFVGRDND